MFSFENKIHVLSLCDGMACGYEALKRVGLSFTYDAVEISEKKRNLADYQHGKLNRPYNDVYALAEKALQYLAGHGDFPHYDLFLAGPTCTSLSSQGKREEWEGESKIFFACADILRACIKKNPAIKFLFENVASMSNQCRDDISRELGVPFWLGESAYVSAQDRCRYYWMNWEGPKLEDRGIDIDSVLDPDGLYAFAFSKSNRNKKGEPPIVKGRMKATRKANTVTTGAGGNGQSTMNKVICKNMSIRNLSVMECARLQGVGNYDFMICTNAESYEAIGDGWQVDTIVEILKNAVEHGSGLSAL